MEHKETVRQRIKELVEQFGKDIAPELGILITAGVIEAKTILVKGKGEQSYFRWKKKV